MTVETPVTPDSQPLGHCDVRVTGGGPAGSTVAMPVYELGSLWALPGTGRAWRARRQMIRDVGAVRRENVIASAS